MRTLLLLAACKGDPTGDDSPTAGVTWTEAFDTSTTGALSGVWGSAPDDVWIVGGTDAGGEIHHFDGQTRSPVEIPAAGLLVWVSGFAADDVWAVGVDGSALH